MSFVVCLFFFCKQKTAYEMRISDWSSDVCSSDLVDVAGADHDERFFLSLLAHLSLPYQVDGDIASAARAGSGREPPSPAPPAQRAGWHARFPSAALCTSSLPLQIL